MTTSRRRALFVFNEHRAKDGQRLAQFLTTYMPGSEAIFTSNSSDAYAKIKMRKWFDLYVAVGGDGTLNTLVDTLLKEDMNKIVGVIPAGSGNDFATVMGYEKKNACLKDVLGGSKKCLQVFHERQEPLVNAWRGYDDFIQPIDVGYFNSDDDQGHFLSYVGAGFLAEVVKILNGATTSTKRYVLQTLKSYMQHRKNLPFMDMHYNYGYEQGNFFSVELLNSTTFGKGLLYNPHGNVQDGFLELVGLESVAPKEVPGLLWQVKQGEGKHLSRKNVLYKTDITDFWLESEQPLYVHYDGESSLGSTHTLEVRVLPSRLRFISPNSRINPQ